MEWKGASQIREHTPDSQKRGLWTRAALIFFSGFLLISLFFLWVDHVFPEWMPDGEIIFLALGFSISALFYSQKQNYLERYGASAYRKAFLRIYLPGSAIVFGSLVHLLYMPGPQIPALWWKTVLVVFGACFTLSGLALLLRAFQSIGIDELFLYHVYFPEEGRMPVAGLYEYLRHPISSGCLQLGIGLALVSGGWYSLLMAILLPLGFTGWVRLVEEKELLRRFGQTYSEYRKRTPAFWIQPRQFGGYARGILAGFRSL